MILGMQGVGITWTRPWFSLNLASRTFASYTSPDRLARNAPAFLTLFASSRVVTLTCPRLMDYRSKRKLKVMLIFQIAIAFNCSGNILKPSNQGNISEVPPGYALLNGERASVDDMSSPPGAYLSDKLEPFHVGQCP